MNAKTVTDAMLCGILVAERYSIVQIMGTAKINYYPDSFMTLFFYWAQQSGTANTVTALPRDDADPDL